jgi:predicted ATPase/transcriptional regulator with XRE-family HTH domain
MWGGLQAGSKYGRMDPGLQIAGEPSFGELLRRYRLAAGLSQESLAERARISKNGLGALERGERRTPQRETLALLIAALALAPEQRRALEAAARRPATLRPGDRRSSVTVGPWPETPSSNLPHALTSFVGRERELAEIVALVSEHRLVTVTGTGGIGKTRTALEAARLLSSRAVEPCLVELAPVRDPALVAAAIAAASGLQEVPDRTLLDALVAYLKNRHVLLLLDNCEHVVAEAARVALVLLQGAPGLRILATSRELLRVAGEHSYRLPSLAVPSLEEARTLASAAATRYAAIGLFVERARAVDRQFELTGENVPIVAEICRRLDSIPLAIELAAARMNALSASALAARLDQRFEMLSAGGRTALPRQQTMRATIDWSYDLLSAGEQRVFERLSVFAGGCGLATATAICADEGATENEVFEILSSLVDKSLVVAANDRFRLLESTRAYALEKLTAAGEREVFARRHAEYFRNRAVAADESFGAGSTFAWMAAAELELGNYRAALEWALVRGNDAVLAGTIAGALGVFWHRSSLRTEGRFWCELALSAVNEAEQPRIAARLWLAYGRLLSGRQQVGAAERALRLFESASDERWAGHARRQLAWVQYYTGRAAEANDAISLALATARRCEDASNEAYCLYVQALVESARGRAGEARSLCSQAIAAFDASGDEIGYSTALSILAEFEFTDGRPEPALRLATEAQEIQLRGRDARLISGIYSNMAAYSVALGDHFAARASAEEGLRWASRGGLEIEVAILVQHLALLSSLGNGVRRAAELLGYVDAQFTADGYQREWTEQWSYDKLVSALRAKLSDDEIAEHAAAGAAWPEERALREALFHDRTATDSSMG